MAIRSLLRAALACLLALAMAPAFAQPAPPVPNNRAMLLAGDFAGLERLYAEQSATPTRTRSIEDELPSVAFFHSMDLGLTPADWPQDDRATLAWLKRSPASVPAAIARAYALSRRSSMLDQAGDWAGVEKALREQQRLLVAVKPKAAKDITWHALYVELGSHQGWPPARIRSAVEAGLGVDPTSLYFYYSAGRALSPDWRGSAEPLEWLARQAAARTARTQGVAMYATIRMWTAELNEAVHNRPFADGRIDWKMMDQGMTQLYLRTPNDSLLNQHAALACRARDKAATGALLKRIGTKVHPDMWKLWGGVSLYEECRKWVGFGSVKS